MIDIIPKLAPADNEYTPSRRRIVDSRLEYTLPDIWGVPSPDGCNVDVLGDDTNSNVWVVEGF